MEPSTGLQVKLGVIEKEQQHQQKYLDKIDIAIEKLEEISANTVKIMALHEQKLDLQYKTDRDLQNQIDTISNQFTNHQKNTATSIASINIKLDNIQSKNDSMAIDIATLKEKTEKTMSTLERYFWLFSIVVSSISVIVLNYDKVKSFLP